MIDQLKLDDGDVTVEVTDEKFVVLSMKDPDDGSAIASLLTLGDAKDLADFLTEHLADDWEKLEQEEY